MLYYSWLLIIDKEDVKEKRKSLDKKNINIV